MAWLGAVTTWIVAHAVTDAQRSSRQSCDVLTEAHADRMTEATPSARWLELVSTVLLALATVATAWAAYQSRQWTGEQAQAYSHATATRIAENRASAVANRQAQIDVATFIHWVDAHAQHNAALADFYQARFRDEFKPAFAAWLATKPFENPRAPPTPFAMPQYRLKALQEADQMESTAAVASERGEGGEPARRQLHARASCCSRRRSSSPGSARSCKPRERGRRSSASAASVFLATLIWISTFPVHLTI